MQVMAGFQLLPFTGGMLHCLLLGSFDLSDVCWSVNEGRQLPSHGDAPGVVQYLHPNCLDSRGGLAASGQGDARRRASGQTFSSRNPVPSG